MASGRFHTRFHAAVQAEAGFKEERARAESEAAARASLDQQLLSMREQNQVRRGEISKYFLSCLLPPPLVIRLLNARLPSILISLCHLAMPKPNQFVHILAQAQRREVDQLTTSLEEAKRRIRQATEEKRRTDALSASLQVCVGRGWAFEDVWSSFDLIGFVV